MEKNFTLHHGDCLEVMKTIPMGSVDLLLTSPPYDNLRTYNGSSSWDFGVFQKVAVTISGLLADGGVCVWVVGDSMEKGSETGSSFKQVLYFKEIGLNIHDTMLYGKKTCPFPSKVRYNQSFEYMFVLSKGAPKTVNLIKDRPNITTGRNLEKRLGTRRQTDGSLKHIPEHRRHKTIGAFGTRENIWYYKTGIGMHESNIAHQHPATFPLKLAEDHISSWSNPDDTVLDCFMGSGTSGVAAVNLGRKFIGIEMDAKYFEIAQKRVTEADTVLLKSS